MVKGKNEDEDEARDRRKSKEDPEENEIDLSRLIRLNQYFFLKARVDIHKTFLVKFLKIFVTLTCVTTQVL
jgi:hypothetical protein